MLALADYAGDDDMCAVLHISADIGSETDYDDIEQSMRYICDNFYEAKKDFDEYRMRIRQEKAKFNEDVEKFSNFFKLGG